MASVGDITGIIGAVTGGIALWVSIKSYQHANATKALDLRLALQNEFSNLDIALSGIEGYLDYVHQSHIRVMAATGRNRSGEMMLFEQDFAGDKARLRGLLGSQEQRNANYDRVPIHEIERQLVAARKLRVQLSELQNKYQKLFESDEERRKEIRAQHVTR